MHMGYTSPRTLNIDDEGYPVQPYGIKENPYSIKWTVHKDWPWARPEYEFAVNRPKTDIVDIYIDPSYYMADINRENNSYFNQP